MNFNSKNIKQIKSQLSEEARKEARIYLRIKIVTICVGVAFIVTMARAVKLHCFKDKRMVRIASQQYNAKIPQSSRRGKILDRAGRELAVSLPVPSVYADPRTVSLTEEEKAALAEALEMDEKELSAKLKSPRKFVWLKRKVDNSVIEKIKGMAGIYYVEESRRFYPNGELASHILGAVGMDSDALAGIELANDKYLGSKKREALYKRDARGKFYFAPVAYVEQDDVADVVLTIDKQVQFVAESSLGKAVTAANAKGGTAIVMDVRSGAILAMANMPSFDPNRYSKYSQDTWRNRAITDSIEPGSTFKTLIVASALDGGAVTTESKFDCENGALTIGKATLHDSHSHGTLSVRDIIKVSSNIGAYKVARELGKEKLFEYLRKFGIGSKTGIDYPGEVNGIVRNPANLQPVEFATIAFGQGISVTPIQMAAAFASIANGGKYMKPYVIDRIVNNQGIEMSKTLPAEVSSPVREETARTMLELLEGVVNEGGTGTRAASKEYQMGGKTGTAQKVGEGTGHYAAGKYYASFIGIAPTNAPRIAIFVGLDEPKGAYYGGTVSAPVFREIAETTLKHLDVPSSLSRVVAANQMGAMEGSPDLPKERKRFQKAGADAFAVPDLRGITMRDVMNAVGQADVKLDMDGSGLAFEQSPPPGGTIREGETFKVSFRQPD